MANEGESYLDELLNTVAPDWEETSVSPGDMLEDFDEEIDEEISLEDALAILDDLPDEYDEEDGGWNDEEGLLGLDQDFGEEADEMPSFEEPEVPDETPAPQETEIPDEMPSFEETAVLDEMPSLEEEEPSTDETEQSAAYDSDDEEPIGEDEPDIPIGLDDDLSEPDLPILEESPEPSEEKTEKKSKGSVDVDDIFQDALSAVGYSGGEEEDDEDYLSVDPIGGFMEDEEDPITSVPATDPMNMTKTKKPKKEKTGPGFFARIFGNIITDQTAEEEEKERQEEAEALAKKAEEKAEKKAQAATAKEEKAQLAQEEKERKKQLKAEQAAKKAEEKAEKKRLKEEKKAEEAAHEVVGKINPVGAAIVVIFFATIGIFTIFGSILFSRSSSLKNAENYFASGEYMRAYNAINMVDVDEANDVLYRRIRMCTQIQKELDSYTNYTSLGYEVEALDSLLKGIRYCDLDRVEAAELNIIGQVNNLEGQIAANLSNDFGLTEDDARELLAIPNQDEYTKRLVEITGSVPVV